ncbi:MAG: MotA/TolQ/ExbB proton channel family protein [Pseudomonadota bacterium]
MDFLTSFIGFFQSGGMFMYFIALVLVFGLAIALERYLYLSGTKMSNSRAWKQVGPMLENGSFQQAANFVGKSKAAISKMISYGLDNARTLRRAGDIEMAMEEGLMEIIPRLEKRTHYIATLANIATLLGLLGTIMGLIEAFTAVSAADPSEKANLLSASISIAMNTTAFGLMVGIPLLLIHSVIQAKTTELVDSMEMASVKFVNAVTRRMRAQSASQAATEGANR